MTEYGRGPGSEPWHPNDPLYGDQGWGGQQAASGQGPYGGQQHYPQQPHHPHQQPQYGGGHQAGYPQHDFNGGWDTGQQQAYDPYADPYGGQPATYGGGERPDAYGNPDAYPPPQPPGRRHEAPPERETDWDPGPNDREHAFFAGGDDDDDYDEGEHPRASRRGGGRKDRRGKGQKKRRSGCACLVVTLVFAGGIGGVGYFGYQFYQDRFGSAEDYSGDGNGEKVTVDIPKGAGGYVIGNKLEQAGVVKSADAFVSAQGKHPKGLTIQAGVYSLEKEMSADAAVEQMLDPKSRNNLIIAEGRRNAWVYEEIDKRLEVDKGTTEKYAKDHWKDLGLPGWATKNITNDVKDPLEGFLFPSSYPVAKGQKPADVLKKMVATANSEYEDYNLEGKAADLHLKNPLQLVTVASLVQAEGKYKHDFEKVATVVYNRLKPNNTETYGLLDFDSTVNYLRGKSELATGSVDQLRKLDDPYNTYKIKGLPPGPISNPGAEAIKAALNPAKGNWYYFVSVSEDKTLFAETNEEQNRNREKYLQEQNGQ
ncbi:endolytic transglycosylase MltG [Streptomyces monticola]|uniref:Endolytic murein transglycosylase n=1 Tax=Streptomyces monticola TaxID=2666263 RepID=A0ABW2JPF0_9ACTN